MSAFPDEPATYLFVGDYTLTVYVHTDNDLNEAAKRFKRAVYGNTASDLPTRFVKTVKGCCITVSEDMYDNTVYRYRLDMNTNQLLVLWKNGKGKWEEIYTGSVYMLCEHFDY